MLNSLGLLDTCLHGYKAFREESGFTPTQQEVVFLAISLDNGCEYCMTAHSMIADKMSGVPTDVLAAMRKGETIPGEGLDALAQFTKTMVQKRGWLSQEGDR